MEISARIDDGEVQALLARLAERTRNLKPALQEIGALYERSVLENFQAEKSPEGAPWRPNSPATLLARLRRAKGRKAKKRAVANKKILVDSGDLYGGIHSRVSGNTVSIGVSGHIPYARIHQFGGKAGRGNAATIPARPYLAANRGRRMVLAEKDRRMVIDVLREHVAI